MDDLQFQCRHFRGDRPCKQGLNCNSQCPHLDRIQLKVLLIHLGALGAVVRSTSLPSAIRRKFSGQSLHLTWVTDAPAGQLLKHHPQIDRVVETTSKGLIELMADRFEFTFVVDKGRDAMGLLAQLGPDRTGEIRGFRPHPEVGSVPIPATTEANELYAIGLSNDLKFYGNTKTENQLIHEALGLNSVKREPPKLYLSEPEANEAQLRRGRWIESTQSSDPNSDHRIVVGFNTGCAETIPYKKLSVEGNAKLLRALDVKLRKDRGFEPVYALLGGGESDRLRNYQIAELVKAEAGLSLRVVQTETLRGLRDGIVSVAACDVVFSGDSLGMHMAIALGVPTIAWFGPTCAHEIDFFGNGEAIKTKASCSPCWRRSCERTVMCYEQIDWDHTANRIADYAIRALKERQKQVVRVNRKASDIQL